MSTAPNRLTPEEYLELERKAEFRSEYYNGEMYAMSGGSPEHSRLSLRIAVLTSAHLERRGCQQFGSDMRLLVEPDGLYTYPDYMVVCGRPQLAADTRDTIANPVLVVEVLSPSTEQYDRGFKTKLYRDIPSVREILLISQKSAEIELYRREEAGRWSITTVTGLDASIGLASIDFTLRLADLYQGILPETADSAAS
jgi:Uma2 family endonuclease